MDNRRALIDECLYKADEHERREADEAKLKADYLDCALVQGRDLYDAKKIDELQERSVRVYKKKDINLETIGNRFVGLDDENSISDLKYLLALEDKIFTHEDLLREDDTRISISVPKKNIIDSVADLLLGGNENDD